MSRMEFDAVIVGAGPAGLSAAITLADRGGRACLLDAAGTVGGALLISRGYISGAGTRRQRERGIADSAERHYQDVMAATGGRADPPFLHLATRLQGPMVDWLEEAGFEMAPDLPRPMRGDGGGRTPRTYWGREGGLSILRALRPMLEAHVSAGRIVLQLGAEAVELVVEAGRAVGVVLADQSRILGRAVVLTTGGYAANPELFSEIHDGADLWSGAYAQARGAGLRMGLKAGGVLVHDETFTPNFGGVLDRTLDPPRYRAPGGFSGLRPPWEIVVNREGRRFFREDETDPETRARALQDQPGSCAWVVYDAAIREAAPSLFTHFDQEAVAAVYDAGIVTAEAIDTLAEAIDAPGLQETVADYNRAVASGRDRLGRVHLPRPIATAPFYALPIAAYTVRSAGGLKVDTAMRVLDRQGRPIPGLFAAGEILGGLLSGPDGQGGMSLSAALAFGRWLGQSLAVGGE